MSDSAVTSSIDWKSEQVIQDVDVAIERSIVTGDPTIALEYGRTLQVEGLIRGLALAKLFYEVKSRWEVFKSAGVEDDFETIVYVTNGYQPSTIDKYVRLWKNIFVNPSLQDELKGRLAAMPIGQLLLLSAAASDGDLDEEAWQKVTVASNKNEVRDIVRKARGERTSSSNSISLKLYSRDGGQHPSGTIVAYQGDSQEVVGYLTMGDSELCEKAMSRIINGAGIVHA